MKLLRMIGLQTALIVGAAFMLAFSIRYPDWRHRPSPAPAGLIITWIWLIPALVTIVALFTHKTGDKCGAMAGWTIAMLIIWWYIMSYLLINTYGS